MERLKMRDMVQDHAFALPLRQSHMADATGLTPVHVNRVLGTLRDDGIIELSGGTLRIANLLKLQRLADVN
jgi:CRP-like cAMP-binding protein